MGDLMAEPAEILGLPREILWRIFRHGPVYGQKTVGEVLALYRSGEIHEVPGLGRTRIKAVREALQRAGLELG